MAASYLEVFQARLDGAWNNLVWWKLSLPISGHWNWEIFKVPPSPTQSVILLLSCISSSTLQCFCEEGPWQLRFIAPARNSYLPEFLIRALHKTALFSVSRDYRSQTWFIHINSSSSSNKIHSSYRYLFSDDGFMDLARKAFSEEGGMEMRAGRRCRTLTEELLGLLSCVNQKRYSKRGE